MKVELKLSGIHCQGCVNRIDNLLSKTKGINYEISLEEKTVIIDIKDESVLNKIVEKLEDIGFDVDSRKVL